MLIIKLIVQQDPMSHRIIEKRRRDRMNNCLADLSRLIPPEYLKKGRGRVEKTEIIEMAIRHLKYLQERANGSYGKRAYLVKSVSYNWKTTGKVLLDWAPTRQIFDSVLWMMKKVVRIYMLSPTSNVWPNVGHIRRYATSIF